MRVLIVKAGSTVEPLLATRGDFEDWFRAGLDLAEDEAPVVSVFRGDALPDPERVPAALVTGSAAMVTDEDPWSLATERWLARYVRLGRPLLGVCYGHQLLAKALGGRVGDNPNGPEVGTVEVELTEAGRGEPLFAGLPTTLRVQSSHRQSVLALPPRARHLARNAHDEFQAFAVGERAFAVQFHPEFDAGIVRGYLGDRSESLCASGVDAERIARAARDSEHGRRVLERFRESIR